MLFRFRARVLILLASLLYLYYFLPSLAQLLSFRRATRADSSAFPYSIKNIDLETNCQAFFNEFLQSDKTLLNSDFVFDPISLEQFITDKTNGRRKKIESNINDEVIDKWTKEYYESEIRHEEMLSALQHQMIVSRVFNRCFIQNDFKHHEESIPKIESLLFPWLNNSTSTSIVRNNFVNESKGRGIVITAANAHFDNLYSLIVILRALGNTLPIEVLHKHDLFEGKQEQLKRIATGKLDIDMIKQIFNNDQDYEQLSSLIKKDYPEQVITFKDFKSLLEPKLRVRIRKFSNKVLALLFSSFEQVILMDADTVPFIAPQNFFEIQEYKETGAFFFKDRELMDKSSEYDLEFWRGLVPNLRESQLFGHKSIDMTKYEKTIRYLRGFTHFLESGVVLIDKKRHAGSILVSAQLQNWRSATKRIWGDKEFFWISMLISGDEDFSVNENAAGALGQSENSTDHKACSVQPVHVYKDDLLWINSGFQVCKKATSPRMKHMVDGSDQIKKYKDPVNIDTIVIPPNIDDYYLNSFIEDKKKYGLTWRNMPGCAAFEYCANQNVNIDGEEFEGKLIILSEQEKLDFNFLGVLWTSASKISFTFQDDQDSEQN